MRNHQWNNSRFDLQKFIVKHKTHTFFVAKFSRRIRQKEKYMIESSKLIECIQIVQLHENKIGKQAEEKIK